MKLLDKKVIAQERSVQRKQEIDEGMKLAKKIDILRETSAQEEKNLALFRIETLKKVREDIDSAIENKNALVDEIKSLENRRVVLLEPLDRKWFELSTYEEHLNVEKMSLYDRRMALEARENTLKEAEIKASNDQIRIAEEREMGKKFTIDARNTLEETKKALLELQVAKSNAEEIFRRRNHYLNTVQASLETDKQEIKIMRVNNESDRLEINKEKRQLRDQRETLERALKRIKK